MLPGAAPATRLAGVLSWVVASRRGVPLSDQAKRAGLLGGAAAGAVLALVLPGLVLWAQRVDRSWGE